MIINKAKESDFSHRRICGYQELVAFLFIHLLAKKNILIIGNPATGKTYLWKKLQAIYLQELPKNYLHEYHFISTDDYMHYGYKEALYQILEDIARSGNPSCIEGVQGYRLLRKGIELGTYSPDVVVELQASPSQIEAIYKRERPNKDYSRVASFNKMHQSILNDYFQKLAEKGIEKPMWITFSNEYRVE